MVHSLPHRVLAVDPATGKSGWAILDIESFSPLSVTIVKHAQIDGDKLLRQKQEMSKLFTAQFCKVDALYEAYKDILVTYKPDQVISEGAFGFNHMSAFLAISLAIDALRRASRDVLGRDIVVVPPTISKLAFTGRGGSDKDHMRLAYQTNTYLQGVVADDFISEHEIDAVAHGIGYVRRDLIGDVVQNSAKDRKAIKKEKQVAKELRKEKALAKKEGKTV